MNGEYSRGRETSWMWVCAKPEKSAEAELALNGVTEVKLQEVE
jgi:hypothetical protein